MRSKVRCIVLLSLAVAMACLCWNLIVRTSSSPAVKGKDADAYTQFADAFSAEDTSLMNATLWEFTQTLEEANITYFMIEGTLLGSYRHLDRIPWDDDVDLAVNVADKENVTELFRNSTSHTLMNVYGGGEHWKFFPKDGHPISGRAFRSPFIDIFWYDENASHIFYTSPQLQFKVRKSDLFPLRRRPFGEFLLPAPCNTTAYLSAASFWVDQCVSRHLNHLNVNPMTSRTVPCSRLTDIYPFVSRQQQLTNSSKTIVVESQIFNGTVVKQWSYEDDGCTPAVQS